jgi:hypothetical protein
MLVRIGVDQATAAPAPILFSILRREIPLKSECSGLMAFPLLVPLSWPKPCPASVGGRIIQRA